MKNNKQIYVSGMINFEADLKVKNFPIHYYPIDYPFFDIDTFIGGSGYNISMALKNFNNDVTISGFVFTMPDFKDNYFVCARNMILSGNEKVVGFLCNYEKAYELLESEWVEVTGIIEKGFYQTDMPVIKVKTIKKITAPQNSFVNPPIFTLKNHSEHLNDILSLWENFCTFSAQLWENCGKKSYFLLFLPIWAYFYQ